jgi:hypothetical protein
VVEVHLFIEYFTVLHSYLRTGLLGCFFLLFNPAHFVFSLLLVDFAVVVQIVLGFIAFRILRFVFFTGGNGLVKSDFVLLLFLWLGRAVE